MIAITGLTKTIGSTTALAGIDLSIDRGERVAIAGPADNGRAVLMRILATLSPPSAGRVVIGGLDAVSDVYRVRRLVSYAGATPVPANRLRVIEYLRFVADVRRQPSTTAAVVADITGLSADAPIATLTDRMRGRLPLAAALATNADVLLLDDAFHVLDPVERDKVFNWLDDAGRRGTTIIVAANDDDVPALCQRTVRLHAGRVVEAHVASAGDGVGRSAVLVGA